VPRGRAHGVAIARSQDWRLDRIVFRALINRIGRDVAVDPENRLAPPGDGAQAFGDRLERVAAYFAPLAGAALCASFRMSRLPLPAVSSQSRSGEA
jgi:hypothetical protein